MQYMLLIYGPEQAPAGTQAMPDMAPWNAYTDWLREKGIYGPATPSRRRPRATTIRVRDGQRLTTDGPFAETKEVLGGYYLSRRTTSTSPSRPPRLPGCVVRLDRGPPDRRHVTAAAMRRAAGRCRERRPLARRARRSGEESGRALATLIRLLGGDFDAAEEAVADAFVRRPGDVAARRHPRQPGRLDHDDRPQPGDRPAPPRPPPRRRSPSRSRAASGRWNGVDRAPGEESRLADERLRLIFTCCHPALPLDARVALTLRTARRADDAARSPALSSSPRRRSPSGSSGRSGRSVTPASPTGSRRRPAGGAPRRRARRPLPRLQRGLQRHQRRPWSGASSATRRSGLPRPGRAACPRPPEVPRSARAAAAPGLPP